MKTTKTKSTSGAPIISKIEADRIFVKSIPKNQGGGNDYVRDFCLVCDRVLATRKTIQLVDFFHEAKSFELPPQIVKELYSKWKEIMVNSGRLQEVNGCYEESILVQ